MGAIYSTRWRLYQDEHDVASRGKFSLSFGAYDDEPQRKHFETEVSESSR